MNARGKRLLAAWAFMAALLTGCSAPQATLDLITAARKGLAVAQEAEAQQHQQVLGQLRANVGSLDAAFDADVRLVVAGGIESLGGEPVTLSAEWVISARKGYAAARDAIADQMSSAESAHLIRQDNLQASDEALEMASQLIVQHSLFGQRVRQALLNAQQELSHGR